MRDFSEYRSMVFVDGENFTIRGQEFARAHAIELIRGAYWEPDTFLWMPSAEGDLPVFTASAIEARYEGRDVRAERAYYYTALVGDDERLLTTRLAIRNLGFEPNVFKKAKGTRSKGVDVSLTTALVAHAYRQSYDVAYLIAGDGDYAPMVEEAKRAGRRVFVVFFEEHGLSRELQIAGDMFLDLGGKFVTHWQGEHEDIFLEKKVDELVPVIGLTHLSKQIQEAAPDLTPLQVNQVRNKMVERRHAEEREQRLSSGSGTQGGTHKA
jgi:uncharacterized LabA/DUF88 family protein